MSLFCQHERPSNSQIHQMLVRTFILPRVARTKSSSSACFTTNVISAMGTRPAHPTYEVSQYAILTQKGDNLTTQDALTYLNSLQTKFAILEERRKKPPPDLKKNDALNEMLQWVCDIGYQVRIIHGIRSLTFPDITREVRLRPP